MTTWLIDKFALVRLAASPDAPEWAARIERGVVRITTVTRLEVCYSAKSGPDLRAGLRRPPLATMPVEYLTPAIEDRAVGVQALLADRGQHRAPSIPDLIIAAAAELASLTVLHLDKDFEIIADITGLFRSQMSEAPRPGGLQEPILDRQGRHRSACARSSAGAPASRCADQAGRMHPTRSRPSRSECTAW